MDYQFHSLCSRLAVYYPSQLIWYWISILLHCPCATEGTRIAPLKAVESQFPPLLLTYLWFGEQERIETMLYIKPELNVCITNKHKVGFNLSNLFALMWKGICYRFQKIQDFMLWREQLMNCSWIVTISRVIKIHIQW